MRMACIVIVLSLAFVFDSVAQKKGGPPKSTPIQATIHDAANGFQLSIGSDGAGAYEGTIQPSVDNLSSEIIIAAGLYGGHTRRAHFRFVESSTAWGGTNSPPFAERTVEAQLALKCVKRGVDVRSMVPGESQRCPLVDHFGYNRETFRLGSNSASEHGVPMQGEDAEVTCLSSDAAGCRSWQIRPSGTPTFAGGDPNAKSLSILFRQSTDAVLGYYYMSFLIDVAR